MKQHLNNLLALGEGFTPEFKRSGTSDLGREIGTFANANGREILPKLMSGEVVV